MRLRTALALLVVLALAGVCVRLGFWQISRWHEKRARNAALSAALQAAPIALTGRNVPLDSLRGHRVEARGQYDETRQILLSGRSNAGSPGVDVVTPLVLAPGARAILVDRGWLYAGDAATSRPQDSPEPGLLSVRGTIEPLRRGAGGPPLRMLASGSTTLYSARWLDSDTLERRFPYTLAPYVVRQMPGPGVPDRPRRRAPEPLNEMMHLSYAIQWFFFAAILLVGSASLAWSRRRSGAAAAVPER